MTAQPRRSHSIKARSRYSIPNHDFASPLEHFLSLVLGDLPHLADQVGRPRGLKNRSTAAATRGARTYPSSNSDLVYGRGGL